MCDAVQVSTASAYFIKEFVHKVNHSSAEAGQQFIHPANEGSPWAENLNAMSDGVTRELKTASVALLLVVGLQWQKVINVSHLIKTCKAICTLQAQVNWERSCLFE